MSLEKDSKLDVIQAVPFFEVSNIEASIRFYVDGLGFEITNKWLDKGQLRWCWLQLGGAALMLQEFKERRKVGKDISVYFVCKNALAIYRELTSRGIQATRPFVGNGMWVTGLSDPDGFSLFFESITDKPENTEYSGQDN